MKTGRDGGKPITRQRRGSHTCRLGRRRWRGAKRRPERGGKVCPPPRPPRLKKALHLLIFYLRKKSPTLDLKSYMYGGY